MVPVAVLNDNYSYFIVCTTTKEAVVVDPADPSAIKVGWLCHAVLRAVHIQCMHDIIHSAEVCCGEGSSVEGNPHHPQALVRLELSVQQLPPHSNVPTVCMVPLVSFGSLVWLCATLLGTMLEATFS